MSVEQSQITEAYKHIQAIKTTARVLGISAATVKRVILNAGLWHSDQSIRIRSLYEDGISVDEIANRLKISRNTVIGYLPYTRGYRLTAHKSANAINIAKTRAKKQNLSKQS